MDLIILIPVVVFTLFIGLVVFLNYHSQRLRGTFSSSDSGSWGRPRVTRAAATLEEATARATAGVGMVAAGATAVVTDPI